MQLSPLTRREFIALAGGTAVAWPLTARAQEPNRMRRIGFLAAFGETDPVAQSWLAAFREELRKLGWMEGRNIVIDTCWAKADVESTKRCSKELVALQPDVILTVSTPVTAAMLQLTRTIPIVFVLVADPIGSGFVASLSQPGGNATGFTPIEGSLGGKWVELLKDIAPRITKVILMFNPPTATFVEGYLNPFKSAAASLGVEASLAPVHDLAQIETLVSTSGQNNGLVVIPDLFTNLHRTEIIMLANRYHVPAIDWSRSFAELGGLMSYGPNLVDEFRRAASYADRILKGAKPSELPVQAPVKFELVINLKTAKALGIEVLPTLIARADEVIE
jgi:putative tryptophan/tyrosine transport system substrate-binding protein